jgi:endoglucanase
MHNDLILTVSLSDSDGSGTHTDCVTDNVGVFTTLATWLKANGNRKALLSETGGGNTESCKKAFATQLAFLKKNSDVYMGFTVWSAGAFDSSYELSVTPNGDVDSALWTAAVKPLL